MSGMGTPKKVTGRIGAGRPGPGRPKGVPNKITTDVRTALHEAFEGMGGVPSLISWGKREPSEFYRIWVKILPTQVHVAGHDGGPLLDGTDLARMAAQVVSGEGSR